MISARIMGGMGNELFIYAAARAMAERLNVGLALNTVGLDNDQQRCYALGLWKGVTAPLIRENWPVLVEAGYDQFIADPSAAASTDFAMYGYWQDERYFKDIEHIIRAEFVPKLPLTERGERMAYAIRQAGDKSVILSIRRGDYVSYGVTLPYEYYLRAANYIGQHVKNPIFFISTDDVAWAKQEFRLPYTTIVFEDYDRSNRNHLGREDEELWLHSLCKHALLANSTFSWWGAWLNTDNGIVAAPKDRVMEGLRLPYPEGWIEI